MGDFYQEVYCLVSRVPYGRVVTYGQVAAALGDRCRARGVGYALHILPSDTKVPWHRVINRAGRISIRGDDIRAQLQRMRLEAEGIEFDDEEKVNLKKFRYHFTPEDIACCKQDQNNN